MQLVSWAPRGRLADSTNIMNIEQVPDRVWLTIVSSDAPLDCEFLALSLFITNARRRHRTHASPPAEIVKDIKAFFQKYGSLPSTQRDLAKLVKLGGHHV
jgi:hypothetical protein